MPKYNSLVERVERRKIAPCGIVFTCSVKYATVITLVIEQPFSKLISCIHK